MNFDLTDNQKLVKDMVRDFAEKELKEKAVEIDKSQEFPWDTLKKMAKLGLLGIIVPEEYGGAGMDFISLAVAVEEISRACASTGVIVAVNVFGLPPTIYLFVSIIKISVLVPVYPDCTSFLP